MELYILFIIGAITGILVREKLHKCRVGTLAFTCLGVLGALICNYLFVSYNIQIGDSTSTGLIAATVGPISLLTISRVMHFV